VRFWDSSALVPLLVEESSSAAIRALLGDDPAVVVWQLAGTEVTSALWRRRRADEIDEVVRLLAGAGLAVLEGLWTAVEDTPLVDRRARRLLALHPLRAADALHLAAALIACDERTKMLPFVTLDDRLADAARREGFRVLPED
jgi:predicted nucleic acid-binding protein